MLPTYLVCAPHPHPHGAQQKRPCQASSLWLSYTVYPKSQTPGPTEAASFFPSWPIILSWAIGCDPWSDTGRWGALVTCTLVHKWLPPPSLFLNPCGTRAFTHTFDPSTGLPHLGTVESFPSSPETTSVSHQLRSPRSCHLSLGSSTSPWVTSS